MLGESLFFVVSDFQLDHVAPVDGALVVGVGVVRDLLGAPGRADTVW